MAGLRLSSLWSYRAIMAIGVVMVGLMTIMSSSFWLARRSGGEQMFALPVPAQVASIVELIDATPPDQRDLVLRAVNSGGYDVFISSDPGIDESSSAFVFQAFRRSVQRYTDALEGRRVYGMVGPRRNGVLNEPVEGPGGLEADYPMRLVVELGPEEFLVIETPDLLDARLRRMPIGLLVGLAAFAVAVLALIAILAELSPIGDMAKSARAFSVSGRPQPVARKGSREMRRLIDEFNRMQDRISRLMANRTLVMSGMSHDVRTYLTRLRLRVERLDEQDREAAIRAVEAIEGLLDDTLAFSEAESGGAAGEPVELDVLLDEICQSGVVDTSAITREGICAFTVLAHRSRLERAFVNIISNALKYAGSVEISCQLAGEMVDVHFRDHGPGIPDEEKSKVLEPFYRLDEARNLNVPGSGLGLAITRRIVERHGGSLVLKDAPGGGLLIIVSLPAL